MDSDQLCYELFGSDDDDDLKFLDPPSPAYEVEEPVPGLVVCRKVFCTEICRQYFAWLNQEYFPTSNGVNQGMHFGRIDAATPLGRLCQVSQGLYSCVEELDQAIINLYERGEGIGDHVDLLRFDDGIVGFSFGGTAVMRMRRVRDRSAATYAKELETEDASEVRVELEAGDVYLLSGEARYRWTHGIPKKIDGEDNIKSKRISVTLRKLSV
ncbi:hypothetical protein GGI20_000355 [Coemansia sp. BCRC 34301]|nr:hypothetical protein GGI20_000355 [Coemansia sp. BCRC 34301]